MPAIVKAKPVTVKITIDSRGIIATPDPVPVARGERNVPIRWRIKTRGWRFTEDGIVIHKNHNQFVARRREESQVFHWKSRNTDRKLYEYTINVTNGTTTASRDPGIKNGGK
jgi:hypothetical protein